MPNHPPADVLPGAARPWVWRRRLPLATPTLVLAVVLLVLLLPGLRGVDRVSTGALSAADQRPIEAAVRRRVLEVTGRLLADGSAWSSASAWGSVLVVNFWASWCRPCRQERPRLNQVAGAYQGRGDRFLGVNVKDDRRSASAYVRELPIPYPSPFDPQAGNATRLGVVGLPTTFILDRDGMVGYQLTGKATVAGLSARLEGLRARGGRWAA
jgi:thiol-disulfide isomerase/thioredoxin